jgi:putative peptidoglycan lipid II flippase
MGAIASVSRAFGFVRVLVLAAVLGTSYLGNAFQSSNSLSNVLFELLAAGALSAVLVPTFVGLLDDGDQAGAEEVAGGVLGVAIVALGGITVAGIAAAPLLAHALTLGVPQAVAGPERELVTFLLRFCIPQVVLYAAGTVAIAALHAKRRFAVTVAAPIASTVVMVGCFIAFRVLAGADPGLRLSTAERWLLVAASSGGVVAFVGVLLIACRRSGFRLWPRFGRPDARVRSVLQHSAWGVVLHTGAGLLLGASVVLGSSVEGAVVAYQVSFAFFLAPYAVLAQPIHTAILPELTVEAKAADMEQFRASVRWGLERMLLFVAPVSAVVMALALPGMRSVTFGSATHSGPGLLAAALAALAVGLFPYGAFLLLSRAAYALGDSRTPGLVSVSAATLGVIVMVAGRPFTEGAARVALLGAAHSVAYGIGALVLGRQLARRTAGSLRPACWARMVAVAAPVGVVAWLVGRLALDRPGSRLVDMVGTAAIGVVAGGVVLVGYRLLGLPGALPPRVHLADADTIVLLDRPEVFG